MKIFLTILFLVLAGSGLCERQPFERYQSIVDRQMFGLPPPGFDPMKPPSEVQKLSKAEQKELTQEQEKLQSSVHFSVIRVAPDGMTQVGFTDNSDPKAPRNYFLKVGETQDGWTVKEADAAEETTTIVKDDVEIELKIGDNSGKGGGKTSKAGANVAAGSDGKASGLRGGLFNRGGQGRMMSLRERRAAREQQAQAAKAEADAQAAATEAARQEQAALEKAEREEVLKQQRQQLMAIQEELRKAREARQNEQKSAETESGDGGNEAQ